METKMDISKILNKTDQVILGCILPTVTINSKVWSRDNPAALTKEISNDCKTTVMTQQYMMNKEILQYIQCFHVISL